MSKTGARQAEGDSLGSLHYAKLPGESGFILLMKVTYLKTTFGDKLYSTASLTCSKKKSGFKARFTTAKIIFNRNMPVYTYTL